jgi:uncharacterized membrane protein (TIGR02234 family)
VSEHGAPAAGSGPSLPRSATLAALVVVAGVAIGLIASSPVWIDVTLRTGGAAGHAELHGRGAAVAVVPLALVAAAGLIALALVRGWVRRILAVLIAAAGAGMLVSVLRVLADPDGIARGDSSVNSAGQVATASVNAPAYLVGLGALLVIAGAVIAFLKGTSWPAPTRRYERAAARAARPRDDWEALEQGEDPTR